MGNRKLNQNNKRVFPEDTPNIIESLLRKYGLETMKELWEKFGPIKTFKEKKEFQERWEKLPGPHIARILKEVALGKIGNEKLFTTTLQERLNIPEKTAKELAKDLNEKVLNLVQKTFKKKEEVPLSEKIEKVISPKKPAPLKKKDIYREPID